MDDPTSSEPRLSRRTMLQAGASVALGAAATATLPSLTLGAPQRAPTARVAGAQDAAALFRGLDAKIEAAMAQYHIPGAAVGVYYQGQEYVRGYGVTNVDYPQPVDGDTLFRIGSTTKTFTGTTVMRQVDQALLDLDAPVRSYLPNLRLAEESVAARVKLRQCLNHSAGWLGDYCGYFGRGADAIPQYVAGMPELPQLTPPGQVIAYNNAAVVLAGHVIERVAGRPYEDVVREQVLAPLGLDHSFFFSDEIVGFNAAAPHSVGQYWAREVVLPPGPAKETWVELSAVDGRLRRRMTIGDISQVLDMAFYRDNYVVMLGDDGQPTPIRANFLPGPDGRIAWFSFAGRLYARQG